MPVFYTGSFTAVWVLFAGLSTWLLKELPRLVEAETLAQGARYRWLALAALSVVFGVSAWLTNRRHVMRAGPNRTVVKGPPNTLYYVRLEYWAVAYSVVMGVALSFWNIRGT